MGRMPKLSIDEFRDLRGGGTKAFKGPQNVTIVQFSNFRLISRDSGSGGPDSRSS